MILPFTIDFNAFWVSVEEKKSMNENSVVAGIIIDQQLNQFGNQLTFRWPQGTLLQERIILTPEHREMEKMRFITGKQTHTHNNCAAPETGVAMIIWPT